VGFHVYPFNSSISACIYFIFGGLNALLQPILTNSRKLLDDQNVASVATRVYYSWLFEWQMYKVSGALPLHVL